MRRRLTLTVILLLVAPPAWARPQQVVLAVPGIACKSCAGDISGTLQRLPGVTRVGVDLSSRQVTVRYDDASCSLPKLLTAIDGLGFTGRLVPPTPARQRSH